MALTTITTTTTDLKNLLDLAHELMPDLNVDKYKAKLEGVEISTQGPLTISKQMQVKDATGKVTTEVVGVVINILAQ